MYERTWTVRFSDTDPFGIAHYPRIIDALHETSDMFMEEIGWPFWELADEHGFGLPIVEVKMEFSRPIEAGDEITIGLTPELGTTSVRFEYTARADGDELFDGYEQRVCTRKDAMGAMEVPDDLRRAMEAYVEN